MQGQKTVYATSAMTKEQFFYAYKELAHYAQLVLTRSLCCER